VRVGVLLLPADPWVESLARAQRIEALGYAHLWTYDHLSWRRYREHTWHAAMPWLTGIAANTAAIRLGTMVATPNFRHPVTLAKETMTLDHVSAGRFDLGLGAGGVGFDSTVLGGEVLPPKERSARFAEFVDVLDLLLREPAASHHGRHYTVDDARMIPGCLQQPRVPFAIAAGGPRTLAIAARHGDAWITFGDSTGRDLSVAGTERAVRTQIEQLATACKAIGRDPASIRRLYLIGNTEQRPLANVKTFVDFARRYADLGFTDLVFHHPRPGDPVWTEPEEIVEQLAVEALPALA
jgi:alkanesulfonate monooxygenase SsuD/methylene tetrahydromethanopterin reductase-like flavin-dependent oxidoreductase (luciferase family)